MLIRFIGEPNDEENIPLLERRVLPISHLCVLRYHDYADSGSR